jgi:hypothetical protein
VKDLGKDMKDMMYDHPTMPGTGKKIYPNITLPASFVEDKAEKVGDKVELTLKGTIKSIHKDNYSSDITIEVTEGEIEKPSKSDSLMDKAEE